VEIGNMIIDKKTENMNLLTDKSCGSCACLNEKKKRFHDPYCRFYDKPVKSKTCRYFRDSPEESYAAKRCH
jgi:hypothetical protein